MKSIVIILLMSMPLYAGYVEINNIDSITWTLGSDTYARVRVEPYAWQNLNSQSVKVLIDNNYTTRVKVCNKNDWNFPAGGSTYSASFTFNFLDYVEITKISIHFFVWDQATESLHLKVINNNNGDVFYEDFYGVDSQIHTILTPEKITTNRITFYFHDHEPDTIARAYISQIHFYEGIPEPTTLSLLALGVFLAGRKRKAK